MSQGPSLSETQRFGHASDEAIKAFIWPGHILTSPNRCISPRLKADKWASFGLCIAASA
jgi:hypothetical protein